MGFHLHSFCHNHYITEESLAGKTPEKIKVVSEMVRKKNKTTTQQLCFRPEEASRSPTAMDKAPEPLGSSSQACSLPLGLRTSLPYDLAGIKSHRNKTRVPNKTK